MSGLHLEFLEYILLDHSRSFLPVILDSVAIISLRIFILMFINGTALKFSFFYTAFRCIY